jgi:hypothetical protein
MGFHIEGIEDTTVYRNAMQNVGIEDTEWCNKASWA